MVHETVFFLQRNGIQLDKSFYLHFAQALTKCQDFWRAAFCIGLSSGWIFLCKIMWPEYQIDVLIHFA